MAEVKIDCKPFSHVIDRRQVLTDDTRNPVLNQVCVCKRARNSASGTSGLEITIVNNDREAAAWAI